MGRNPNTLGANKKIEMSMSPMYKMSDELLSSTQKVAKFEAHCFV